METESKTAEDLAVKLSYICRCLGHFPRTFPPDILPREKFKERCLKNPA